MVDELVRQTAKELRGRMEEAEQGLLRDGDAERAFALVKSAFDESLETLSSTGLWGRDNELPSSLLWNEAGEILSRGWMQHRARSKPRGYAGDYQLLGRMVRGELCDDPVGRLFDRYFQQLAAPIAVRNRSDVVRDWIVELVRSRPGVRSTVAIIGCGPAIDVEQAAMRLTPEQRSWLEVRLLDYDPQAIEHAIARITRYLPAENVRGEATSLFRIPKRPKLAAWLTGADLIACVGMFDYLEDPQAGEMLATFYQHLAPGGTAAVFNFSPRNTSRAYMEWIGNWYLLYRDEADMQRMADLAGLAPEMVEHGAEPYGVDLYLRARKPAR